MRVLFVGDVCGDPGRQCIERLVPQLREELQLDAVIANSENATRGMGIAARVATQILSHGVDAITLGNHALRQRDIFPMLNEDPRIIRPANLPEKAPGTGMMFVEVAGEADQPPVEIAVINLLGSLYLDSAASAFDVIDELIERARARTPVIMLDMHAEATSEKVAMGHYVAGRVNAVVGTHTHVQTSDARLLDGATAYITDLGMTGPHDSVIGVRTDIILKKLTTGIGQRFEPATGGVQLEGAVIDFDAATGRATAIEAIRVPLKS